LLTFVLQKGYDNNCLNRANLTASFNLDSFTSKNNFSILASNKGENREFSKVFQQILRTEFNDSAVFIGGRFRAGRETAATDRGFG